MLTIQFDNIKVNLSTDIKEWGKEFYGMPDDAILINSDDLESKCMGFGCIDNSEIWIYKAKNCQFEDLLSTVAHELGHLIEGGYKKNPPQTRRYDSKHEKKAKHYEDFVVKSHRIATALFNGG